MNDRQQGNEVEKPSLTIKQLLRGIIVTCVAQK